MKIVDNNVKPNIKIRTPQNKNQNRLFYTLIDCINIKKERSNINLNISTKKIEKESKIKGELLKKYNEENESKDYKYNKLSLKPFLINSSLNKSKLELLSDRIDYVNKMTFLKQRELSSSVYKKINPYIINQKEYIKRRSISKNINSLIDNTLPIINSQAKDKHIRKKKLLYNIDILNNSKTYYFDKENNHSSHMKDIINDREKLKISKKYRISTNKHNIQNLSLNLNISNRKIVKPKKNSIIYGNNNIFEKLRQLKIKRETEGNSLELVYETRKFIYKNNISHSILKQVLGEYYLEFVDK